VPIPADVISEQEWTQLRQHLSLSAREAEILKRVIYGKSTGEIAYELGLSTRTVRTKIDRMYKEFDLSDRVNLVLHVLVSLRECWEQDNRPFS
jgi:DNA-binding CsgD family transcriptional regulator